MDAAGVHLNSNRAVPSSRVEESNISAAALRDADYRISRPDLKAASSEIFHHPHVAVQIPAEHGQMAAVRRWSAEGEQAPFLFPEDVRVPQ